MTSTVQRPPRNGVDVPTLFATLDAVKGEISVNVSEEEFARRRTQWTPRETEYGSGAIWKYAQLVGPARYGALTNPGARGEKEQYANI